MNKAVVVAFGAVVTVLLSLAVIVGQMANDDTSAEKAAEESVNEPASPSPTSPSIYGTILGQDRLPLANAQVELWKWEHRPWTPDANQFQPDQNTKTDDNGKYAFGDVPEGQYEISIPSFEKYFSSHNDPRLLVFSSPRRVGPVDVDLSEGTRFTFRVRARAGSAGYSSRGVLYQEEAQSGGRDFHMSRVANSDGWIEFGGAYPRKGELWLGWKKNEQFPYSIQYRCEIEMPQGRDGELSLDLPTSELSGSLELPEGQSLQDYSIYLRWFGAPEVQGDSNLEWKFGSSGDFQFPVLFSGLWRLEVRKGGEEVHNEDLNLDGKRHIELRVDK